MNTRRHRPCTECGTPSPYVPYCEAHARDLYGVEIKESGLPNANKGLFATRAFRRGDRVATYGGERISCEEADRRYGVDGLCEYGLTVFPNRWVLDAIDLRGYGSMANDARGARPANIRFTQQGEVRATRGIRPGDELFASYGSQYWNE
jgi:hypothetical protein